jgi:hypothetical protein
MFHPDVIGELLLEVLHPGAQGEFPGSDQFPPFGDEWLGVGELKWEIVIGNVHDPREG